MPTNAPKIYGPDGTLRSELVFSTSRETRFFTGTMDSNTVDMEVSIRGGAYTNDSDLILFEGTSWTIPNPAAYPDGLDLLAGDNTILLRAIGASGETSPSAVLEITLLQDSDFGVVVEAPTNVSVERRDQSVVISVEGIADDRVTGYNVYASQYPGGGSTGYQRVNLEKVVTGVVEEETSVASEQTVTYEVALDSADEPASKPLYVRVAGTQVDQNGSLLQSDFSTDTEIDQAVRAVHTTVTVTEVREVTRYSFEHDRSAGPSSSPPTISISAFTALSSTDPLYYVVTAVYYDSDTLTEVESSFSPEVVANPLRVRANVGNFPVVSRQQITRDFIASVFRSNRQVKVEPGSVLRDTVIDPFASEAERLRFVVDFLHRAQSFAALLQIDDPSNTGTSTPVSTNPYKQALKQAFKLKRDADVQAVIDRAFEQLASNFGIFRRPGRFARGEVTFFLTRKPTRSYPVPIGSEVSAGSVKFRATRRAEIPFAQSASFRDPVTGRYLVRVPVQAINTGVKGNVGAGQVRKIDSALSGLSVTNESAMFGGTDTETNRQLAERARNALASVDPGTERGYLQTMADVPGILQARVVGAMDPLMQRDYDTATKAHRGGKVDIWIQGNNVATVTDTFAFTFEIARNIQFELISDPADLEFRAVDPNLSDENPIVEVLDFPDAELELVNATTGEVFDQTGLEITGYNTIKLSQDVVQPSTSLTDVVLGSYRRRATNKFAFSRQPVRAITSISGSVSGALPASAYQLHRAVSPLTTGRSALAADFLTIVGVEDSSGNITPSGDLVSATDEEHVLVGSYYEYLDNLGANYLTVRVYNEDRSVEYRGPNDPSGVSDYTIITGNATTPVAIQRVDGGSIESGQTVLVDYQHDENFVVTYQTNLVVETAQAVVDGKRHLCADVLVKEGVEVPVDISATIVLTRGASKSTVETAIRTALQNLFNSFRLGEPLRQSDVVATIEGVPGVSYVLVPLTKMVRSPGSLVVREALSTDQDGDSEYISAYSSTTVAVWLLKDRLSAATSNGGGPTNEFRAVFQDGVELDLQGTTSGAVLGVQAGRAMIVGSDGKVIDGYSDDATLETQGFRTEAEKEAERMRLTADRVLISTAVGDAPSAYVYHVTYVVAEDEGANNIEPSAAEYLVLGDDLDFTFDEDN